MSDATIEAEVRALYRTLLEGWNNRNAVAMAETFAEDGEMIGFDGSLALGRADILSHLEPIFAHHQTAVFVSKVKSVRLMGVDAAILRSIVGMVPPGQSDIVPAVNAHQTLVATKSAGVWRIALFQNTPAQFHGRPELVEEMSAELRELLS